MITFVTDIKSSKERDILAGFELYDLVLIPMQDDTKTDNFLRSSAPQGGWTQDELCRYSKRLVSGDAYLVPANSLMNEELANSLMNEESAKWIGSSEV